MQKSPLLPIVSDLPLSTRSDAEVLKAIGVEIKGLKMAQAAIDEAAAEIDAHERDTKAQRSMTR